MIYATTELALKKLLDENKNEILKTFVRPDGSKTLVMTNKLQCQYHRLMKNFKETKGLWE